VVALMEDLTPKQKKFCDEYLIDFNATQAYMRAGYAVKDDTVAAQNASRLLRNAKVIKYIAQRKKARMKRIEVSQDKVIAELAKIAFANTTDYVQIETKGKSKKVIIKDTSALDDEQLAAISNIKEGPNGIEVKLHMHGLGELDKFDKLYIDRIYDSVEDKYINAGRTKKLR
jgi:phage terminase small subunit